MQLPAKGFGEDQQGAESKYDSQSHLNRTSGNINRPERNKTHTHRDNALFSNYEEPLEVERR